LVELVWAPRARRELDKLDDATASRVRRALERFASSGRGDVVKLAGREESYRLRVGTYRAVFRYRGDDAIEVLQVAHRRNAYR